MTTDKTSAHLRCMEDHCGASFAITERLYTCPACGGLLDVAYQFNLPSAAELKTIFRSRRASDSGIDRSGVWRFRELLAFVDDAANVVTLFEGNTPVYAAPRSAD